MGEELLRKFGRYFLLDRVAQGGMAEIFRARLATSDGAGRLLVIKRITAAYGENHEFVEMFKSEIKVSMGFNHPNIIQIYDFGDEDNQPFIAMEFVDGRNVKQFLARFAEQRQAFPIELAAFIIEQAAGGLHYAHTFRDKMTGELLDIVHRDISPQNILVSYDGSVKVIDFGIAKATTNTEATQAGIIKGKPSYLSPEQISGEVLDGRCDIFALGICLWELLTGRKLFSAPGENEFAVLKQIENAQTHVKPPSTVNPTIPKELDYIVLKALAKNRNHRYQTAEEFQRALHKFLYSFSTEFNPADVAYYSKSLFKEVIVEDRKRLLELNQRAEDLLLHDIPETPIPVSPLAGAGPDSTVTFSRAPQGMNDLAIPSDNKEGVKIEVETATPGNQSRRVRRPPRPAPVGNATNVSVPRNEIPKQSNQNSVKRFPLGAVASVAAIIGGYFAYHAGYDLEKIQSLLNGTSATTVQTTSETPVPGQPTVTGEITIPLRLSISPLIGSLPSIVVNGQRVDPSNPVVAVPLDKPLELSISRDQFNPISREFVIQSSQVAGLGEWRMDIEMEPLAFGFISIKSTPSADAEIQPVDSRNPASQNQTWKLKTPIENEKFPVGTYNVRLVNAILGMEKTVTVKVEEGQSIRVNERLEIQQ